MARPGSGCGPSATTSSRDALAARVRAKVQAQLAIRKTDGHGGVPTAPHDRICGPKPRLREPSSAVPLLFPTSSRTSAESDTLVAARHIEAPLHEPRRGREALIAPPATHIFGDDCDLWTLRENKRKSDPLLTTTGSGAGPRQDAEASRPRTPSAPGAELFTDGARLFARTTTAKNSSTGGRICVSEVGLEWLDEIEGELQHVDDAALDGHDTSTNLLEGLVPDVLTELCAMLDTTNGPTDFLDDFIASLSLEELEELTLGMTGCRSCSTLTGEGEGSGGARSSAAAGEQLRMIRQQTAMQELLDDEFLDVENDLLDPRMRFDDEDDDDESSCEEVFESDDQVEEDVEMVEEANGRKVEVMSAQHDAGAAAAPGEVAPAAGNTLKAEGGPSTATAARQSTMGAPKAAKRRAKTSASIVTGLLGEVNHDGKQILSMDVSKVKSGEKTNLPEILATAGADKAVKLWRLSWMEGQAGDLDEGDVRGNTFHVECLASLSDHYETVNVVRWHPTEAVLASGGADGNLMFYKLVGGGSWRRTKAVRFQSSGGVACEVTDLSWTRLGPVLEEGMLSRTTAGGGRSAATSARPVRAPAREILVTTDNGDLHIVDYVTGEKKHRISVSEETVASFQLTFKLRREQQERQMFAASQGAEKLASGGMGKDHTGFLGSVDPSAQMLSADDIADGLDRWVGGQIDPWGRVIVAMNCSKKGNLIPFVWRWSEKVGRFEIRRDIAEGCWSEMSQENRAKMIFSARPCWDFLGSTCILPFGECTDLKLNLVHYYAPIFARDDWSQPLLELRVPIDRITHVSQGPICKMKVPSADGSLRDVRDPVEVPGEGHRSTSAFRKVRVPPKAAGTQKIQEPAAPAPNYELFDVGTREREDGENPKIKPDSCSSYHSQPVSLFATVSNRNNVLSLWSSHKEQALLTIGNFIPENEGLILDLLLPNDAQSVYMTTNTGAFFFVRRSRRWLKKATKLNVEYFEEEARKKVVTSTGMKSVNAKTNNKAAVQEPHPSEVGGGATLMTRLYDAEIPESVVEIFEGGNHGPPDHAVCDHQQHLQHREFKVASCFPGCGSANTTAYNDLLKHLHKHKGEFPAPTKNLRELFLPESTLGRAADPSEKVTSDVGTECARLLAELSAVVDIPVKEILRTTASSSSTPSKSTSLVSVVEDLFATAARARTCGSARDPRSSKKNADHHLTPVLLIGPNGKLLDVASSSPGANDDDLGDLLLQEHDGVAVLHTLPDELVDATLAALESGHRGGGGAGGGGGGGDHHQVGNLAASGREQQPKKNANEAISIRDGLVLRSLLQEFAADSSDDQARAEIHTLLKKALLQPPAAGGASSSRGVADLGESQRALKLLAANKEEVERVEALEQTESETVEKVENENHNHHNLLVGATSFREESGADPSTSDHGSHLLPAEPVVHVQTGAALGPSSSSSAVAERRFVVSRGHMLEVYEDGVQKLPATTTPIPLRQLTMSQNSPYLIGIGIGADGARRAPSHPRVVIFDMNLCAVVVTAPLPVKRPKRIFVLEQTDKADDSCPLVCVEADLPLPPPPSFSTPSSSTSPISPSPFGPRRDATNKTKSSTRRAVFFFNRVTGVWMSARGGGGSNSASTSTGIFSLPPEWSAHMQGLAPVHPPQEPELQANYARKNENADTRTSTSRDAALQQLLEQEQQLLETLGAKDALSALDWRKMVGRDFVERSRDGVRQIGCYFAVANCLRLFEAARHFAKGVMMHYGGGGAVESGAESWSGGKELEFVPCTYNSSHSSCSTRTSTKAPSRPVTLEVPLACSRGLAAVEEEAGDAGHDEAEQFSSHLGGDILRNVGVAKLGNGETQRMKIVVRLPEPEAVAVEGEMAVGLLDGVGGDVNMMDDGRKRAKFAR